MNLLTKTALTLATVLLAGCGRYIHIRDTKNEPVAGATVSMTSERIVGECAFGTSDAHGDSFLSIQVPGVTSIIARKTGYLESRTTLVDDDHIVLVMVPEK